MRILWAMLFPRLLEDLGDDAGAHGATALADRKPQPFVHRDRRDQLDRHLHVVPRHHHLHPRRQLHAPGHVRRPEVELRPVPLEERRVPTPLLLVSTYTSASKWVCGVIDPDFASTIPRSISVFSTPRSSSPTLSPASPWSSSLR